MLYNELSCALKPGSGFPFINQGEACIHKVPSYRVGIYRVTYLSALAHPDIMMHLKANLQFLTSSISLIRQFIWKDRSSNIATRDCT